MASEPRRAPDAAGGAEAGCLPSSRMRSGPTWRRASRTDRGSGSHPARRPRSMSGGDTGESAITSATGPTTSGSPFPGTSTMVSAKGRTRSRRCSASSTVRPRSWTKRVSEASTSSAAAGSRAEVGSSSTRTRGAAVSTAPMATRCCWPPESVDSGRSRSSCRPSRSSVSSTRRRITAGARPRFSIVYASSSSTASVTNVAAGFCPTTPTTSASSRGGKSLVDRPSTHTSPDSRPPVK